MGLVTLVLTWLALSVLTAATFHLARRSAARRNSLSERLAPYEGTWERDGIARTPARPCPGCPACEPGARLGWVAPSRSRWPR